MLANASSRDDMLDYISQLLTTNKKLSQIHANHDQLVSSSSMYFFNFFYNALRIDFMLQLASTLLDLSEKIPVEKVHDTYIFHPKTRVQVQDDSPINMDSSTLETYKKTIGNFNHIALQLRNTIKIIGLAE